MQQRSSGETILPALQKAQYCHDSLSVTEDRGIYRALEATAKPQAKDPGSEIPLLCSWLHRLNYCHSRVACGGAGVIVPGGKNKQGLKDPGAQLSQTEVAHRVGTFLSPPESDFFLSSEIFWSPWGLGKLCLCPQAFQSLKASNICAIHEASCRLQGRSAHAAGSRAS